MTAVSAAGIVGREPELRQVEACLDRVGEGRGKLLLLTGEAGAGKTAVAEAAAERAGAAGVAVRWGRGWEGGGAPPLWLWTQILREHGDDLRLPEGPERFTVFEAVRSMLAELADAAPLLLVLDDLHAAGASCLELLRYVAQELRGLPLVLIGAYRPLLAKQAPDTDRLLAAIARDGRQLPVRGLSLEHVRTLLARAGHDRDPVLPRRILHATAGNPLLVTELIAGLDPEAPLEAPLPLPHGLRTAIRRRLAPLEEPALELLGPAAVVGEEVELSRLRAVLGWERDRLLEALGACRDMGVLRELGERPGRYRFQHPVVQQAVLADLPPAERAALHRRAAAVIEEQHAEDLDPHLDDLARHHQWGAPEDVGHALRVVERAARRAEEVLDLERAAARWQGAVDLAERGAVDRSRRCDLLLRLGEARSRAGHSTGARQAFVEASRTARAAVDWRRFARAALGAGGIPTTPTAGVVDATLVDLLTEALEHVDDDAPALRALLLGRLAMERYYVDPEEQRETLTAEAVDLARRSGDPAALGAALNARHHALWSAAAAQERFDDGTEILDLARRANDPELALQARSWRVLALLELGDATGLDREIAVHGRLADALAQPYHRWNACIFQGMRALLEGRFGDAEQAAQEALELGASQDASDSGLAVGPDARIIHAVQLFDLRREQGRLPELEETIAGLSRSYRNRPVWRCALALLRLHQGRREAAREEVDLLAADDFERIPDDHDWLAAMTLLAEVVAQLGDAERARQLHRLLAPYEGRVAVVAQGASCRGAVAHHLGLLSATAGQHEVAVEHLERALEVHEQLGARPFGLRTRLALATSLRALGGGAGRDVALLREAHAVATELGLADAADRAAAALARGPRHGQHAGIPSPEVASEAAHARLVRSEGRWIATFEDREVHLRDTRGVHYLARLLARPGEDHPAVVLERRARPEDEEELASARARFDELRDDLAEATRNEDRERLAVVRERMAALAAELTEDADRTEQARVNVTRAIRTALRHVAAADPSLGAHLEHAVRTGTACSYRPDPRAPISWTVDTGGEADA